MISCEAGTVIDYTSFDRPPHQQFDTMAGSSAVALEIVLEFVIQRSDLPKVPLSICSLLCTSSSIRNVTTQHCAGRMVVGRLDPYYVRQQEFTLGLAQLMTTQGHLLHSLQLALPYLMIEQRLTPQSSDTEAVAACEHAATCYSVELAAAACRAGLSSMQPGCSTCTCQTPALWLCGGPAAAAVNLQTFR